MHKLDIIEVSLNIHGFMPRKDPSLRAPGSEKLEEKRLGRGRPPKIDSEHLLNVARQVFLERGIRATTQEVAERAGVSEGTLFHRFKSKEGLFRQAMQVPEDDLPEMLIGAVDSIRGLPAEEALLRLAQALLDIGRVAVPLMMMSWSNPVCSGPPERQVPRFRVFIKGLAGFFEVEMEAGRMRQADAEIVARAFLGAIHHYCMTRLMTPDPSWVVPESMYVRGLVDLILRGTLPRPGDTPPRSIGLHRET